MSGECIQCGNHCLECICEKKETFDRTWISLGNRQFFVEDVQSILIQANHLIINFDYTDQQIVIYFGRNEEGYKNAKKVFDILGKMYNAYVIDIPANAISDPDLRDTAYGEGMSRKVQEIYQRKNREYKLRHQRKLKKCMDEIAKLKEKLAIKETKL